MQASEAVILASGSLPRPRKREALPGVYNFCESADNVVPGSAKRYFIPHRVRGGGFFAALPLVSSPEAQNRLSGNDVFRLEWLSIAKNCVGGDEDFSGERDDGELEGLAARTQLVCKGREA